MPQYGPKAMDREAPDERLPKLQGHAKVWTTSTKLQIRPGVTDYCERYRYNRLKAT